MIPVLKKFGEAQTLDKDALRRPEKDATLKVCGTKCWAALNSDNWRLREGASQAYLNYIGNPGGLPKKYDNKTSDIFKASCEIAYMASSDKLLQVYFTGLKILETAIQEPVCGGDIPAREINK